LISSSREQVFKAGIGSAHKEYLPKPLISTQIQIHTMDSYAFGPLRNCLRCCKSFFKKYSPKSRRGPIRPATISDVNNRQPNPGHTFYFGKSFLAIDLALVDERPGVS
jgi:hypothetical protein